jgi:hypothetical protein
MPKFDCIFINGDSYSAPKGKVYGDFLSEQLQIPVKNYAVAGSNNHRILRSSIEYLNQIKSEFQNPLVIIGWSFIRRLEVWYYGNSQKIIQAIPDKNNLDVSQQPRFITLNFLLKSGEATVEQKSLINEDLFVHKQLTDFYTDLYMFGHFLESQNLSYLFFSAARNTDCPINCFPYIDSLAQVQWVSNNPKIYRLHEFCILDWAKTNDPESHPVTGHLSEKGHKMFAQFLQQNLLLN